MCIVITCLPVDTMINSKINLAVFVYMTQKNEILFSTRFSTTFSTIFSTMFENIKRIVYQYLFEQLLTTKVFLHKTLYTPSFQIKVRVLHRRCFQNHPLFTTFVLVFTAAEVIFHINTNLLILQRNVNIFTQETLYPSINSEKNWRSPSQTFFETSTFCHFFTIFKSE